MIVDTFDSNLTAIMVKLLIVLNAGFFIYAKDKWVNSRLTKAMIEESKTAEDDRLRYFAHNNSEILIFQSRAAGVVGAVGMMLSVIIIFSLMLFNYSDKCEFHPAYAFLAYISWVITLHWVRALLEGFDALSLSACGKGRAIKPMIYLNVMYLITSLALVIYGLIASILLLFHVM